MEVSVRHGVTKDDEELVCEVHDASDLCSFQCSLGSLTSEAMASGAAETCDGGNGRVGITEVFQVLDDGHGLIEPGIVLRICDVGAGGGEFRDIGYGEHGDKALGLERVLFLPLRICGLIEVRDSYQEG